MEYVEKLKDTIHELYALARANLGKHIERQNRSHKSRAQEHSYAVGSLIYKIKPFRKHLEPFGQDHMSLQVYLLHAW